MSLTFIFSQGLPGKRYFNRPVTKPTTPSASAWGLGMVEGPVIKTFAWKSLTENKGKAHIYQDVLVMGSIYVIKSIILIGILDFVRKVRFTIEDPEVRTYSHSHIYAYRKEFYIE